MKKPGRKRRRKIAAALLFLLVFFPFRKYGKVISANDCDPFLSRNGKYISLCFTPPDPKAMTRQKNSKLVAAVSVDPRRDISPGFFGYSYIRRASAAKKGPCNVAFSRPPSVCIEISCEAVVNSTLCHLLQMECSLDSSTTENSPLCNVLFFRVCCSNRVRHLTLTRPSCISCELPPLPYLSLSPFRTCQKNLPPSHLQIHLAKLTHFPWRGIGEGGRNSALL